ncbi:3-oxoacyl-ACP reductase FabG [Treponema sp.]|uniref:3-oxoacyl-ACP reductase FabG n=1 Tax=Treponema sp. TaxID=166 RepID=UPI00298E3120|nr:3-oxoacyl-ACP reductase FabG [Treponema sp.]MCQ2241377.1 3-oxoacyl-ACP reductase FabG [Treponema sp.]
MNEDKKVLVTGASGGIGRAIALDCAKAGYYVICHYNRGKEKAESLLEEIKSNGGRGELIQFDITNREDCKAKLDAMTETHGALWGIVSNAGITKDNTFAGLSGEEWDSVVHTNLDSFFNVLNPLVMPLARKKKGRIITIASVSGIMGNRGQTNYSASKAGIIGATKALATELASRSITVNCIAPGLIETDMIKDAPQEMIMQTIPMKRAGKPSEVSALAVFLLSEEAGYITRQVISVNGGLI